MGLYLITKRRSGIVRKGFAVCVGLLMLTSLLLTGCTNTDPDRAKHVFVFLGDGMGINHVALARYLQQLDNPDSADSIWSEASFDSFPNIGLMTTHNSQKDVTDSAASATAMFSGQKTFNGSINFDPETGADFTPLAGILDQNGFSVGIVSTTGLEHASPASLYAITDDRYDYPDIARQGISCGWIDFWGAGGFLREEDALEETAVKSGFTFADSPEEFRALDSSALPAIVAAADDAAAPYMAYEIDRARAAYYGADNISFADIVSKAISCFDPEEPFFIFAEAAKVDTASAMLDVCAAVHEVYALDDAVFAAMEFYREHPEDTLIVVLSDHETGGLRLRVGMDMDPLNEQVASAVRFQSIMDDLYEAETSFDAVMEEVDHYLGISREDLDGNTLDKLEEKYETCLIGQGDSGELDDFVNELLEVKAESANVGFASASHTNQPVPVYAIGKGAEQFAGLYDNTQICQKLLMAMGIA